MKTCSICKQDKPLFSFYKRPETKDGRRSDCIECFKKRSSKNWNSKSKEERQQINTKVRLKYNYNITVEEYNELVKKQDNKCYICGTKGGYNDKPLYVDHCHSTGMVRKLLCQHCNSGLGMFRDNPELLEKAADYLRKYHE